jgi:GR25 family glycosyltransferase involved in LPS biosynthesis
MSFNFSRRKDIESAYIIKINGNHVSEVQAANAAQSCLQMNMPYKFWAAYDGTAPSGDITTTPEVHKQVTQLIKVTNAGLHPTEIGCLLSHISLWAHCVEIDQPIVVLEHDARMIKPYTTHDIQGAIAYLGCHDQYVGKEPVELTPPVFDHGFNKGHHIKYSHAYSIDPTAAKNLLSVVIRDGLLFPVDVFIRVDLFVVYQPGLYAYEAVEDNVSTIKHRNVQITEL